MTIRRCLVIDDDAIAAVFLRDWLAQQGWQVAHARTLAEATRQLTANAFDVLLVDRHLPDGDGVGWLAQLLTGSRGDPAPRCLVTSGDLIDGAELPAGVDQLRKPIDVDRLHCWLQDSGGVQAGVSDQQPGPSRDRDSVPLLDDAGAVTRFGGNRAALQSLRAMLLRELKDSARWRLQLAQTPPTPEALAALHRLRAACALTGCARLGQLSEAVEASLRRGDAASADVLVALDAAIDATVIAIGG